ncbi:MULTISPECIES: ECF-type sigma factor [Vibrio]|uniref:RNA polymerase sigma-70 ECF-like HTH domain-containing protein n=2 Tax=Vibrio TaxID=662 RepID=A0A510IFD3_9VIBR|nr:MULTISPECIES: helix-turn-helix domain-containing protein [Vibrio]RTZ24618.1 hypothetical protein EKN09_02870 [Vibrio penaeicida]BBL92267.1 hypothetical protein VroAM7_49200 [Vibrio rotiferianus]GLQ71118.1 hypothetical protein GCM10007932_04780 [Vibrio penaeicida]
MFDKLRTECKNNINRMWFLSAWDKEDLTQHMELCILVASEEMARNVDFRVEHVKLFTVREVNNLSARIRKQSSTMYSNTIDDEEQWQSEGNKLTTSDAISLVSLHQALMQIKNNCRGDTQKMEAYGLYLEGYTVREIAEKLSMSKSTANRIITQCSL